MGCHSSKEARGVDEPRVNPENNLRQSRRAAAKQKAAGLSTTSRNPRAEDGDDHRQDQADLTDEEEMDSPDAEGTPRDTEDAIAEEVGDNQQKQVSGRGNLKHKLKSFSDVATSPVVRSKAKDIVEESEDGEDDSEGESEEGSEESEDEKQRDVIDEKLAEEARIQQRNADDYERIQAAGSPQLPPRRLCHQLVTSQLETPVRELVSRKASQANSQYSRSYDLDHAGGIGSGGSTDAMESLSPTSYVRAVVGVNSPVMTKTKTTTDGGRRKTVAEPIKEGDNAVDDDTLGTLPSFSSYNYLNSGDSVTGSSLTRRPTPHPSKFTSKGGSGAAELKASAAMEAYNRTEAAMLYGNEKGTNEDRGPELPVDALIDRYLQKQSSLTLENSDPLPKFEAAVESSSPSTSSRVVGSGKNTAAFSSDSAYLSDQGYNHRYYHSHHRSPLHLQSESTSTAARPETSMLPGTSGNPSTTLTPNNSKTPLSTDPQASSAGGAEVGGVYQPSRRRVAQMFDLKQSEVLEGYKSFHCALDPENGDRLAQGRLFILDSYICFYSDVFGTVHKKVFFLDEIEEICRANTASVVPNAISIVRKDGGKTETFTSFADREDAFAELTAAVARLSTTPSSPTKNVTETAPAPAVPTSIDSSS